MFKLLSNPSFAAMDAKQKLEQSIIDPEHQLIIGERYQEAQKKAYELWEPRWGKYGHPDGPSYYSETAHYPGPYYIVFGSEPCGKCTHLYSSYTISHIKSIESKLRKWFGIQTYINKVSIKDPIPIEEILASISYPSEKIFVDDGVGFPMKVKLGMWRDREGY